MIWFDRAREDGQLGTPFTHIDLKRPDDVIRSQTLTFLPFFLALAGCRPSGPPLFFIFFLSFSCLLYCVHSSIFQHWPLSWYSVRSSIYFEISDLDCVTPLKRRLISSRVRSISCVNPWRRRYPEGEHFFPTISYFRELFFSSFSSSISCSCRMYERDWRRYLLFLTGSISNRSFFFYIVCSVASCMFIAVR